MPGFAGRNFLRCVEGRKESNLNVTVINDSGEFVPPGPCETSRLNPSPYHLNEMIVRESPPFVGALLAIQHRAQHISLLVDRSRLTVVDSHFQFMDIGETWLMYVSLNLDYKVYIDSGSTWCLSRHLIP